MGLTPRVDQARHSHEIAIDIELVRTLVGRLMPDYADASVRRLASSGSTNALFRRQPRAVSARVSTLGGVAPEVEGRVHPHDAILAGHGEKRRSPRHLALGTGHPDGGARSIWSHEASSPRWRIRSSWDWPINRR